MSRQIVQAFVSPNTVAAGSALNTENLSSANVQVAGITGGAVLQIEGTLDGSNWVPMILDGQDILSLSPTDISVDGIYHLGFCDFEVLLACSAMRVNRTVAGTGSPSVAVTLCGRDARTT